jgi:hypothetical protein
MINGPESFCAGAGGNAVATGGNAVVEHTQDTCKYSVVEANEIHIFAEMMGTDALVD